MKHPITIIGGGLAGLALGIGLRRRGIEVVLHEAGTYPRHRVCGEFIRGASAETFERLGIAEALTDALEHRRTAWFSKDGRRLLTAKLKSPALGISRHRLDERLANQFENLGGELRTSSRVKTEAAKPGEVWTAGRRADKASRWIGLKVHARKLPLESELEMHLGPGGYVGLAPIENNKLNICGLFQIRPSVGEAGSNRLLSYLSESGLRRLRDRVAEAEMDEASLTGVSAFAFGRQPADADRCVLGDADRMIPPFTGNGMSVAFESAETALDPLVNYAEGRSEWPETREIIKCRLDSRFRKRFTVARLLHPWITDSGKQRISTPLLRSGLVPFQWLTRVLS